jgi:hypothetical protein
MATHCSRWGTWNRRLAEQGGGVAGTVGCFEWTIARPLGQ